MTSRAPPPALRRLVFGLLFVTALLVPFVLWILVARGSLSDPNSIGGLIRTWGFASALLMVWSYIYVRKEPRLGRIALCLTALLFAIITFRVQLFSNNQTGAAEEARGSAAPGQTPRPEDNAKKFVNTGKIETDIVGKWQAEDQTETDEFFKDGTLLSREENGKTHRVRYAFLESGRLQVLARDVDPTNPFVYDVSIKADTLTMTRAGTTKPATYRHVQTPPDEGGLAGMWKTRASDEFVISTDGSFMINEDEGPWNWTGSQFVAKSMAKNGSTWRLALSSDGNTLSGTWSDPNGKSGTAILTRHPHFENLADGLVGLWELAGHGETNEYRKDGRFVLTDDEGKVLSLQYSTLDSNHIQITRKGVPPLVWAVVAAEDKLTITVSPDARPALYLRVY